MNAVFRLYLVGPGGDVMGRRFMWVEGEGVTVIDTAVVSSSVRAFNVGGDPGAETVNLTELTTDDVRPATTVEVRGSVAVDRQHGVLGRRGDGEEPSIGRSVSIVK